MMQRDSQERNSSEICNKNIGHQKDLSSNYCFTYCNLSDLLFLKAGVLTLSLSILIYKMRIITLKLKRT